MSYSSSFLGIQLWLWLKSQLPGGEGSLQGRKAAGMFSSCAEAFAVGFDLHL